MNESKASRVKELTKSLLFLNEELVDGKPPADAVQVEGIVRTFFFHPLRTSKAAEKIRSLVREIVPDPFLKSGGGGMSFIQLPFDRDGEQWAEQATAESLACLAMAIGAAGYCMPRELWGVLPGGVPYVWFDPEG